jgi:NADPH-dependent ferric siderophore reductase
MADDITRLRREPPTFRTGRVVGTDDLTPFLRRVRLAGEELRLLEPAGPAASIRLLLPAHPTDPVVLPTWTGNEFRTADGSRAVIRTLTPIELDPDAGTLTLDVVRHDRGPLTAWVDAVSPGDEVAVSGPGRGYDVDPRAGAYLLAGDETALPALRQVVDAIPTDVPVRVLAEVRGEDARVDLGDRPDLEVVWLDADPTAPPGDSLVHAVIDAATGGLDGTSVWAAGEAAAVQRIRRHLFEDVGLPRRQAHVRGYWKHGRAED